MGHRRLLFVFVLPWLARHGPRSSLQPTRHLIASSFIMSSFHNFRGLPTKLRNQIWNLAAEPRRVKFFKTISIHKEGSPVSLTAPVPPLLHACQESRALMKTLYKKAGLHFCMTMVGPHTPYAWINSDVDTIFLVHSQVHHLAFCIDTSLLRRLTIGC